MADNNVKVVYSEFTNSPVASEIEFELLTDVILNIKYDPKQSGIVMTMSDAITENTELSGFLDSDKVNVLIKSLSQIKGQLKAAKSV